MLLGGILEISIMKMKMCSRNINKQLTTEKGFPSINKDVDVEILLANGFSKHEKCRRINSRVPTLHNHEVYVA